MFQDTFEKVMDSLVIDFVKASHMQVVKPVKVFHKPSPNNRLLIVHKGKLNVEAPPKEHLLYPNSICFIPAKVATSITYGTQPADTIVEENVEQSFPTYVEPIVPSPAPLTTDIFTIIEFNVKAYNAIDFFSFLEIPCFEIEHNEKMSELLKNILEENQLNKVGKKQMLYSNIVSFIVILIRYIIDRKLFLQKIGLKMDALMDRRIIDIFSFCVKNLAGDLSNTAIANHISLSKDYIGQFFKKLTNVNLQEYIKSVRITNANVLASTTNMKIQDICHKVGINDFAYFCRIFKNTYGATAKQVQQRHMRLSAYSRRKS